MKNALIRFLLAWSLVATCLLFMQKETQKPLLVYHADSKAQKYSAKSSRKDDTASYTRLPFVTTVCSWLRKKSITSLELEMR